MDSQTSKQAPKRLTPEETQTLYHPLTYTVRRINSSVYSLWHAYTGLKFYAKQDGSAWRVLSSSGNEWTVSSCRECNCPDSYRASKQGRFCKHQAVVAAVVDFIRREENPVSHEESEKSLEALKGMFGC